MRGYQRLSIPEFREVIRSYNNKLERIQKEEWERARFGAVYAVQPYSKRTLKAQDICVFPWDDKNEEIDVKALQQEAVEMLKEMRD